MAAGNSSESGWVEMIAGYEWYKPIMAIIAIFSTAYLQVIRNQHYKIVTELWLSGFLLFSFLTASNTLSFYVDAGTGTMSIYSFRLLLVALLAQAVAAHLNQGSTDPPVQLCITISNILMRSILLLCFIYGRSAIETMSNFACMLAIFVLVPVLLGDLIELSKAMCMCRENEKYSTVGDPISLRLSVDAMISYLCGAGILAFPDIFMSVVDGECTMRQVCLLCTQTYGCVMISGSVLSFASLTFRETKDATNTLVAKTVLYLPTLLMLLTNDFTHERLVMMGVMGVLAFNAGYAICRPQTLNAN